MRRVAFAVAAVAALSCGSANAGVVIPVGTALHDFNAIIFMSATTGHDIEGAAVIGGNFTGTQVYLHPGDKIQPAGFGALTVYGNTSGGTIHMENGGNAYVGGHSNAPLDFHGGHTIGAPGTTTISDFQSSFTSFSTSLSLLKSTGDLPKTDNNEIIKANPVKGVAVFNITAKQLNDIPSFKMDMNGAKTVIFNVTGDTVDFKANVETGDTGAHNIIWNFVTATAVNFQTLIAGTVIAPNAHVTNNNQIDGTLVAKSWTGNGELHNYGFDGVVPSAAPEPDTWALMLVGFGTLGMALRLRPRARAATA